MGNWPRYKNTQKIIINLIKREKKSYLNHHNVCKYSIGHLLCGQRNINDGANNIIIIMWLNEREKKIHISLN
jgi:hypothetical protein